MSIERHINEFISEYSVKNHQQAKIKIDNLIKKYPNEKKLLQTAGILFAQNKKFEDAIKIFKKILEKDQQSVETLINIGITYYESNKFDHIIINEHDRLNHTVNQIESILDKERHT